MHKLLALLSIPFFIILFTGFTLLLPQKVDSAGCTRNPDIGYRSRTDGVRSVTYHLYVINRCADTKTIALDVKSMPTNPVLNGTWEIIVNGNEQGINKTYNRQISAGGTFYFSVKITRNINTYHSDGVYRDVIFRAILREGGKNTSYSDTFSMYYEVVNRPDFTFKNFVFPTGRTCFNADPTVKIINVGWVGTHTDIVVQVKNREGGQTINHTVTQFIAKREVIDLSNKFKNMNRPAPGWYNAIAKVDLNKNVLEENEGDNEALSRYRSNPCDPIGVHNSSTCTVSIGWACDPDNYDRSLTVQFFEGSTLLGSTVANVSRPEIKEAGRCGNNSNVGFRFTTPESLKDGNTHRIKAIALNIGSSGSNIELSGTPKTIQCAVNTEYHSTCNSSQQCVQVEGPGTSTCSTDADCVNPEPNTFTIKGGVYNDIDGSGTKESTDPYINGNIDIVNSSGILVGSLTGTGFTSAELDPGEYTVYYRGPIPDNGTLTYPEPQPLIDPQIKVIIGPDCTTSPLKPIICANGDVTNVNFGVQIIDPSTVPTNWIQSAGGDVRADYVWENLIPNAITGVNYFTKIFTNPLMDHGIVFDNGIDLDSGLYNENEWVVKNEEYSFPIRRTSYKEIFTHLNAIGVYNEFPAFPRACTETTADSDSNCELKDNLDNYLYTRDGDLALTGPNYTFNNGSHIFLISGDLTINHNITVLGGSSVLFIVKGNIYVTPNVTEIHGIFSTDETFRVIDGGISPDPLTIRGSVIALDGTNGFINERFAGTNTTPAVEIIYRPDFVLNAPPQIKYTKYNIKEIAPGTILEP